MAGHHSNPCENWRQSPRAELLRAVRAETNRAALDLTAA